MHESENRVEYMIIVTKYFWRPWLHQPFFPTLRSFISMHPSVFRGIPR